MHRDKAPPNEFFLISFDAVQGLDLSEVRRCTLAASTPTQVCGFYTVDPPFLPASDAAPGADPISTVEVTGLSSHRIPQKGMRIHVRLAASNAQGETRFFGEAFASLRDAERALGTRRERTLSALGIHLMKSPVTWLVVILTAIVLLSPRERSVTVHREGLIRACHRQVVERLQFIEASLESSDTISADELIRLLTVPPLVNHMNDSNPVVVSAEDDRILIEFPLDDSQRIYDPWTSTAARGKVRFEIPLHEFYTRTGIAEILPVRVTEESINQESRP